PQPGRKPMCRMPPLLFDGLSPISRLRAQDFSPATVWGVLDLMKTKRAETESHPISRFQSICDCHGCLKVSRVLLATKSQSITMADNYGQVTPEKFPRFPLVDGTIAG